MYVMRGWKPELRILHIDKRDRHGPIIALRRKLFYRSQCSKMFQET